MTVAKKPKGQKIAFAISCILPLAVILLAVLLLIAGAVPNIAFLLAHFFLTAAVIFLLKLTVFSKRKSWLKVIVCILLLAFFVVAFFLITTVGKMELVSRYRNDELAASYVQLDTEHRGMPTLDAVGEPDEIEYINYYSQQMIFFDVDVNALKCSYDASEYELQKSLLNEKYIFQTKPVSAHEYTIEPTVVIDGYTFRMLSFGGEYAMKYDYPKYMMLIATNDEKKEIIYLHYADADIDFIVDLSDFIRDDCGWRFIRK